MAYGLYLADKKIEDRWVAQGYLRCLPVGRIAVIVQDSVIRFQNARKAPVKKLRAGIKSLRELGLLLAATEMPQATRWTPRGATRRWFPERSTWIIAFLHMHTHKPSWITRRCWS